MQTIEILLMGYAREDGPDRWAATSTCVLITDGGTRVLVDPGADQEALRAALRERGFSLGPQDYVFCTHHHIDHLAGLRLPELAGARLVVGHQSCGSGACWEFADQSLLPGTRCRLLHTPGHCADHWSLLLEDAPDGPVAVAGDVFWWLDGAGPPSGAKREDLLPLEDPLAEDVALLRRSRALLLRSAQLVIPGHGAPFAVPVN